MSKLTKDQKTIRIAQECGWRSCHRPPCSHFLLGISPETGCECYLPDYFNNLNDCAKMEKHLGPAKGIHSAYWIELHNLVAGELPIGESYDWRALKAVGSATATQKAETFGKVKGLWK